MARSAWTLVLMLTAPAALPAGVVQTATARLEGKVVLAEDHVTVDGKKVPWESILSLVPDEVGRAVPAPHRIRFRSGESWLVQVLRLEQDKLVIRTDLFGEKTLDLGALTGIDFSPAQLPQAGRQPNTLYRVKGEPIPGKLLGLDAQKLKIDSPLGELNLPRETLVSYVLVEATAPAGKGIDEVTLIDGTLLRGKVKPTKEGLKLEHPLLGSVTLQPRTVRSVLRRPAAVIDLTELVPQSVQTLPLLGVARAEAARYQPVRGDGKGKAPYQKALLIEPKTLVRYQLPASESKSVWLRARLLSLEGGRGDVKVLLKAGSKKWERALTAGARETELTLELPAGEVLELEVDFGTALRFPCGVVLADPHLLLEKP